MKAITKIIPFVWMMLFLSLYKFVNELAAYAFGFWCVIYELEQIKEELEKK